eukprot:g6737.t1
MESKENNEASDTIDSTAMDAEIATVNEERKPVCVKIAISEGTTDSEGELQVQNRVDSIALAKKRLQSKGGSDNQTPKSRFGQTEGTRRRSFSDKISNLGRKFVKNLSSSKHSNHQ